MPSRKRNKGARRKAAKARAATVGDNSSNGVWNGNYASRAGASRNNDCYHGVPRDLMTDPVIANFLSALDSAQQRVMDEGRQGRPISLVELIIDPLRVAHSKSPEALNDKRNREKLASSFVRCGIDILLESKTDDIIAGDDDRSLSISSMGCIATLLVEKFDPATHLDLTFTFNENELKLGDMVDKCPRSIVEFYSKRASCSCLKKHSAVLKLPKTGLCNNCSQRKERTSLMVCAGCKRQQYCSRACQVADWPSHKVECTDTSACSYCSRKQERRKVIICGRCREQEYCSEACRVAHWPVHFATGCTVRNIMYKK